MSPGGQKNLVDEFFQQRSGSASNEKKDAKKAGVVDLEEPEVQPKRIKTLREREAEMHQGIKKIKEEGRGNVKVSVEGDIDKSGDGKDRVSKEKSVAEVHVEKSREAEVVHTEAGTQEEEEKKRALMRVLDRIYDLAIGELKMLLGVADASGRGDGGD
ncbi:hypothetical protein L1987_69037 [Smallanthus sonchifolius]|uniref:Uncharacterized protein n=1 Tax=Smallanthus sonchifolius TaxID=185202 RepID=A0ACB9B9S1_9ASTR|nr:hypothetical protein L1987_69037 [Smallanthus sonchifolius]